MVIVHIVLLMQDGIIKMGQLTSYLSLFNYIFTVIGWFVNSQYEHKPSMFLLVWTKLTKLHV